MGILRAAVVLLYVLPLVETSTAGECDALGLHGSFRVGPNGCVVCGDENDARCPRPSTTPELSEDPINTEESSACYGQNAHPTNMALSGDEDIAQHRIPGCSCHASCAKCGYADMPTGETKCIGASRVLFRNNDCIGFVCRLRSKAANAMQSAPTLLPSWCERTIGKCIKREVVGFVLHRVQHVVS